MNDTDLRRHVDAAMHFARNSLMCPEAVLSALCADPGDIVSAEASNQALNDVRVLRMTLERIKGVALLRVPNILPTHTLRLCLSIAEALQHERLRLVVAQSGHDAVLLVDVDLIIAAFADFGCQAIRAQRSLPPAMTRSFTCDLKRDLASCQVLVSADAEVQTTSHDAESDFSAMKAMLEAAGCRNVDCSSRRISFSAPLVDA